MASSSSTEAIGGLLITERDEANREAAKAILRGVGDAIGLKSAADVERDSPLEGTFRFEAPGLFSKQRIDTAFSLRCIRGGLGAIAVTTCGGETGGNSVGILCGDAVEGSFASLEVLSADTKATSSCDSFILFAVELTVVSSSSSSALGAFGALSSKERDDSHLESPRVIGGSVLWGRVDAIGLKRPQLALIVIIL
jgi:hypothetical protein